MSADQLHRLTLSELRALAIHRQVPDAATLDKPLLVEALAALPPMRPVGHLADGDAAPAGSSRASSPAATDQRSPDPGLPIPDRYGHDRLVLMVQDPQHLFAYWEITPETLRRACAAAEEPCTPVLVVHTAGGAEQRDIDLRGGNYYLAVAPAGTYEASLALRDRHGRLHVLATSNRVQTPAAGVSPNLSEEWMAVDETFHELLELAGLPGQPRDGSLGRLARVPGLAVAPLSSGALTR